MDEIQSKHVQYSKKKIWQIKQHLPEVLEEFKEEQMEANQDLSKVMWCGDEGAKKKSKTKQEQNQDACTY